MASKENLREWIIEALKANKGRASIVQVCKYVWDKYQNELRESGDLFFTWQYDIRWASDYLRRTGIIRSAELSPRGIWELAGK